MALIDGQGREITYLRLSVTDRCDFRCVYCMAEDMRFLPRQDVLSLNELLTVATAFVGLGVRKIRLTGGEPLVRHDLVALAGSLRTLPGLAELALTTNGARLATLAAPLQHAGVDRLNISLDSLRPERFRELTRTGTLADVLAGIAAAKAAGFRRIRLNSVILRGRNDDEIVDLVRFARRQEVDIAFIEEMPLGDIDEHDRGQAHVSSQDLLSQLQQEFPLLPSLEQSGGPARYWRMADSPIRVGVISPHSNNFCATCNRVRVTASGRLLLCLGHEDGLDLRPLLRERSGKDKVIILQEAILAALPRKPERHHFALDGEPQVVRFMSMTGG